MKTRPALSAAPAKAELALACAFGLLIALLTLFNVATRAADTSIFWFYEAAIASMV